ncbi:MAG: response regulator [candidate division KSB1 bacterium]|nr:response regulator [candidate division KSB1 bacterium]MDZ7303761.1 response regulator [candidate division KSB1 bacterium]MDZ7313020.1 response regulator [candidate division KSB1 bacterium]
MDHLKCILVVDDEEDLTWSISKSLERSSEFLEVLCVNDGNSALAILATRRVDLVISDLRMPGRDGMSLLLDIQRNYPETRVIIMTAQSTDELRQEIAQRGTFYYLEKPFDIRHLRKLIYEALDLTETDLTNMRVNSQIRNMIEDNCQNQRTSAMRVFNGSNSGVIHFNHGEIVHAECGELVGEKALFSILNWERGNFASDPHAITARRTIQTGWQTLLNLK